MLYDFHTHLYLYGREEPFLMDLKRHNIFAVTSSVDISSWRKDQAIAKANPGIVSTFGVHPSRAAWYFQDLKILDECIAESPLIGEIGLDKKWCPDSEFEAQLVVFEHFTKACGQSGKYCVVHTAGAEEECLSVLRKNKCENVIIHWYDGPLQVFESMIKEGWYFTFSPALRFAQEIAPFVSLVPVNRLLSETDGPETEEFLGGSGRMPSVLLRVIEDMARIRGVPIGEMEAIIEENSQRILRESGVRA
jgi:TatD DNase family protein